MIEAWSHMFFIQIYRHETDAALYDSQGVSIQASAFDEVMEAHMNEIRPVIEIAGLPTDQ